MNLSTCITPIRHPARRLLRTPGFGAVLVSLIAVTLALLLTLGTADHALLWGPLPYPHGDRLVIVEGFAAQMQASIGFAPGLMPDLAVLPQVDAIGGYDHAPPLLAARLYQVMATDPLTLAAVVFAAVLLVAVACLLPERRAGRLHPSTTLRHD